MYKPPLDARTLILWIGPFGILLAAIMIAVVNLRKRSSNPSENTGKDSDENSKGTNDEYQQQARDLLKDKDSKSNSRSDENKK